MSIHSNFNEAEIIGLLVKGDSEAFQLVFDRYQAQIFATAFSILKTREQAKKVVEEVFADVWEERGSFRQMEYLESYIFMRAKNYILSSWRTQLNESRSVKHTG